MASWNTTLIRSGLRVYKLTLSPLFALFGAKCRHWPSCSEYAAGCVTKHGAWAGGWMTLARLSRCRPGGSSGFDPVPEKKPNISAWVPWRYGDWALTERPFPDHGPSEDETRKDND
ncbi:MAG: membrane protein insertion efficiency factor YidD [Pseudomonadota bacterium]